MALPPINLDEYNARRFQNYEEANKKLLNRRNEKKAQIAQKVPNYFADPFNDGIPVSTEEALALSAKTDPIDLLAQQTAYKQLAEQQMANALPEPTIPTVGVLGGEVIPDNTFAAAASPYMGITADPYTTSRSLSDLYKPVTAQAAVTPTAVDSAGNVVPVGNPVAPSMNIDYTKSYSTPSGPITYFDRNKTPGYRVKDGNKNKVTNNPLNITFPKGGKLPAGAIGVLRSGYNGQDHADSNIVAFKDVNAGFNAARRLLNSDQYYKKGGIENAVQQWSKANFVFKGKHKVKDNNGRYKKSAEWNKKLNRLRKNGIDTKKNFRDLPSKQQQLFMEIMADFEGKWRS